MLRTPSSHYLHGLLTVSEEARLNEKAHTIDGVDLRREDAIAGLQVQC